MLIQEGVRHKGFSLIDILQPCVSFNHVNTYQWYGGRVYDLAQAGHDPYDHAAAFRLAQEWGDRIPIGIFYQHAKPTLTDRMPSLHEGALVYRSYDPARLRALLASL